MKPLKIMIIKDDPAAVTELEACLSSLNHEITSISASGKSIIEKIPAEAPDIVMLDIHIKGEPGAVQTAETIRSQMDTPVVFLTTRADVDRFKEINSTLPFGYLFKPIRKEEVEITLEWLQHHTACCQETEKIRQKLAEKEQTLAEADRKLDAILSPKGDISSLRLGDIIDISEMQKMMDDFYALTDIGVGIVDNEGNILVATGWQEICTDFHRIHPETRQHCIESDTVLTRGVEPHSFKLYQCRNKMWDIVTPLVVGDNILGNVFLGQFFFDDEVPDIDVFYKMAQRYRFDWSLYREALEKVPRWSREKVNTAMSFYTRLAGLISNLSWSNINLSHLFNQQKLLQEKSRYQEELYKMLFETCPDGVALSNLQGELQEANKAYLRQLGCETFEELEGKTFDDITPPKWHGIEASHMQDALKRGSPIRYEKEHIRNDGAVFPVSVVAWCIPGKSGKPEKVGVFVRDISEKKAKEQKLMNYQKELEESNIALKVIIDKGHDARSDMEENILANIRQLIIPALEELKTTRLNDHQSTLTSNIETNLLDLFSPMVRLLTSEFLELTPMEIRIANQIKHGKSTREIADSLDLSYQTVETHRKNIRKKLGIANKPVNLRTHLLTLK